MKFGIIYNTGQLGMDPTRITAAAGGHRRLRLRGGRRGRCQLRGRDWAVDPAPPDLDEQPGGWSAFAARLGLGHD